MKPSAAIIWQNASKIELQYEPGVLPEDCGTTDKDNRWVTP